jgi:hypothetical protein
MGKSRVEGEKTDISNLKPKKNYERNGEEE